VPGLVCHGSRLLAAYRTVEAPGTMTDSINLAEQLRKTEEATRSDALQPINPDAAPWWLNEALIRWGVNGGCSER
jgi:hypothetical protein